MRLANHKNLIGKDGSDHGASSASGSYFPTVADLARDWTIAPKSGDFGYTWAPKSGDFGYTWVDFSLPLA